ncbi:hypothetical protein A8C32_03665 [Flavivirga aquatica]|uniref:Uncharacterized protein n=1 Tax=Flavivirga aquatica TaxID=1849968 RepID=A0A1E5TB18_9FLAO|nr:hypothetical protein [Flavivirga aquatica]OEK08559.1 hypothetical protein A8C32_03665 [Flavivirga aquatica]
MKRIILLFAGLLIGLTTASATELNNQKTKNNTDTTNRYRYAQPIMFIERGIEFLIFPDGSFDFNTNINDNLYDDVYYRRQSRRGHINKTHKSKNKRIQYNNYHSNKGISIFRDRYGKVRRIGNVYLNYDRSGKIKRAGSVYINYNRGRHKTLNQVGGLKVYYNHWGEIIKTYGEVKRHSTYCNFCGAQSCTVNHFHKNRHHNDSSHNNDDNYYYYKQNGKIKKHKKNKK